MSGNAHASRVWKEDMLINKLKNKTAALSGCCFIFIKLIQELYEKE